MKRSPVLTCLLAALALAGCERAPSAPAGPSAAPPAGPGAAPATPMPVLPSAFVVSTNEPFWQARVEDGAVVLDGPEVAGRRFAIEREKPGDGTRVVHARDEAGTIVVRLAPGPCQDSMSGAEFPHAGELVVDGVGPTPGCARPADMPPPRPPEG